ncbi:DUF4304 domain-containing protein [Komagataeibacter sp. AV436]|uniref:DUF4304 domain-containing protein n=2 Tax=Komagataeibacter melomenusus TaxID=2766578 RepID=A0ABX2AEP9_9PROT|nr:DUF4304 domain-containing protein [Komagataeibacter melomenusus]NPC66537.1 DUF4304 domain-containing protein [Komagataeibacter melomenusus]
MTHTRADMDRELKASVVPWLRQQGFRGSLTHFRRPGPDAIDLLTFQFDLRGGGYVLEVARCAPQGYTMDGLGGVHIAAQGDGVAHYARKGAY